MTPGERPAARTRPWRVTVPLRTMAGNHAPATFATVADDRAGAVRAVVRFLGAIDRPGRGLARRVAVVPWEEGPR